MDTDALKSRVLNVFSEIMPEVDIDTIDMAAALTTEYGVDSVSIIQFIVGLEGEFDIEFDDYELALGLYYDLNDILSTVAAKVK